MLSQFFFGLSDSPLHMFHHAIGALLFLLIACLIISSLASWILKRRKANLKISSPINSAVQTPVLIDEIGVAEKPIEKNQEIMAPVIEPRISIQKDLDLNATADSVVSKPLPAATFHFANYDESVCNLKEHLFLFTEILLNKKLTELDWDRRIPHMAMLDFRSYHYLIFQLINLNPEIEKTDSRFKLVLETTTDVAINHQLYFRNWIMPPEMISAFKAGNQTEIINSEITIALQIAMKKSWKLQASTSEQGTMINLLMKLPLSK